MRQDIKHAHREEIEAIAVYLVIVGLLMVFMTIVLAVFRDADAAWQGYARIYGFAWVMIYVGIRLFKWLGVWPRDTVSR